MREETRPLTREDVEVVEVIEEIQKSRTQSLRVSIVEKQGRRYASLQKWWRKNPTDEWTEGKGFHLSEEELDRIIPGLVQAKSNLQS